MADGGAIARDMTLRQAVTAAGQALRAAGIDDAVLDAGLLLAHVIDGDRLTLIRDPGRRLDDAQSRKFAELIAARAARKPVSRLLGRREFWSLDFSISGAVLDPRPDSETAVAAALEQLPRVEGAYRIADFGTGSGCLLLALLAERPRAWGLGLDISFAAVQLAKRNAQDLELSGRAHFMVGDWGRAMLGGFDLIVANPPYVRSTDLAGLAPEVRCHDPRQALDGGADGLAAYRALAPDLKRMLKPRGRAILECGHDQAADLVKILQTEGLRVGGFHADLSGVARCLRVAVA
ncbi:MAG: peptide chain release factor N(5)-glutamine methyltransferase [Alphaproteobacteria bacterium]|jgi:release factor glutamine methyltransferase